MTKNFLEKYEKKTKIAHCRLTSRKVTIIDTDVYNRY